MIRRRSDACRPERRRRPPSRELPDRQGLSEVEGGCEEVTVCRLVGTGPCGRPKRSGVAAHEQGGYDPSERLGVREVWTVSTGT